MIDLVQSLADFVKEHLPAVVLIELLLILLPLFLFLYRVTFRLKPKTAAVIFDKKGNVESAALNYTGHFLNHPRRYWFNRDLRPYVVCKGPDPTARYPNYEDPLPKFFEEGFNLHWVGFSIYAVLDLALADDTSPIDIVALYYRTYEPWPAPPAALVQDERSRKVAAIEAEFEALKPRAPAAKSERLTEADRVERETSWAADALIPTGFVFVLGTTLGKPLFDAMGGLYLFLFVAVLLTVFFGQRAYHLSEAHQRYLRAKARDEDRQWAQEDAAWINYEAALKQWQEQKRERIARIDAMHTDDQGVSNLATDIINHLKL